MQNIYLFYGPDELALKQKLSAWIKRFSAKTDADFDMEKIDAESTTWERIQSSLMLQPLFGGKRLVIIEGSLKKKASIIGEKLIEYLPKVSLETVVLFVDYVDIDQKSKLLEFLKKNANVTEFPAPTPLSMRKQITKYCDTAETEIEPAAISALLARVKENSVRLQSELEKLLSYADKKITLADVELMVEEPTESRIFVLTDALMQGRSDDAARLMLNELDFGTPPLQILGLLISQYRKAITIRDGLNRGLSQAEIQKKAGIAPFLYSKLKNLATKKTIENLSRYYVKLSHADQQLKIGADERAIMLGLVSE